MSYVANKAKNSLNMSFKSTLYKSFGLVLELDILENLLAGFEFFLKKTFNFDI